MFSAVASSKLHSHRCQQINWIGYGRDLTKHPLRCAPFLQGQGKRILGPTRIGAHGTPIFFLHPKDMQGMLTEIMEVPKGDEH